MSYTTVDLKPYLKPGKNVIAVFDPLDMPKTLTTWMQVTITTVSGRTFPRPLSLKRGPIAGDRTIVGLQWPPKKRV